MELKARYREDVPEEATNLEYTVEVASSDGIVVVARGLTECELIKVGKDVVNNGKRNGSAPNTASEAAKRRSSIDNLIKALASDHGITNIVITHEMRSVFRIATRIVFMKDGLVYWEGTGDELKASEDPVLKNFIEGRAED